jgi:hypothetical protein
VPVTGPRFKAPALPLPPAQYSKAASAQFNNALRIYFNNLDGLLKELVVDSNITVVPGAATWIDYVTSYAVTPTFLETIGDGDVYEYIYTSSTAYRLVPSGAAEDAFYSTFIASVLSDKLVGRVTG